jgi:hypothetical protein
MKSLLSALLFLSFAFDATAGLDKDGVPEVDLHGVIVISTDPKALKLEKDYGISVPATRLVTVNGKQMPISEFLQTYCNGKWQNATCIRGSKIVSIDNGSGPRKTLPAGL